MRRGIQLVLGVLLVMIGSLWTLQGFGVFGQSGGMNGQRIWSVIGVLAAFGGLGLLWSGIRASRSPQD